MKQIVLAKCFAGATASLFLGVLLTTCSDSPSDVVGGGGGTAGTTSGIFKLDAAPPGGGGQGGSTIAGGDANCGVQTKGATKGITDVLLVLDRSGSMSQSIAEDCCCESSCQQVTGSGKMCSDTTNCTQRWPALTSAVNTTIAQSKEILWGLKFFSTPPAQGKPQSDPCAIGNGVEVGVATGSAAQIQSAIGSTTPGANTPTAKAITTATSYLRDVKDNNNRAILLATDGEPNCKGGSGTSSDAPGTVTAIGAALTAGFKTYVIGIGPSANEKNLNDFAKAGGTDKYYQVISADALATALAAISTQVGSCTFVMSSAPPDPKNVAVYVDGKLVPQDPTNGWSFGANSQTIVFNGTTCENLKSGAATTVEVRFGCGEEPPPVLR